MAGQKSLEDRILKEFPEFKEDMNYEDEWFYTKIFYCEKDKETWWINADWTRNENRVKLFRETIREYKMENDDYDFFNFVFPQFEETSYFDIQELNFWKKWNKKIFNWNSDFTGAKFDWNSDFFGVSFNWYSDFSNSKFNWNSDFTGAKFDWNSIFIKANFNWGTFFVDVNFNWNSDFSNSIFNWNSDFFDAKFDWNSDFSRAKFDWYSNFSRANFNWYSNFSRANFNWEIFFPDVNFNWEINFYLIIFKNNTDFNKIKLWKDASIVFEECFQNGKIIELKDKIDDLKRKTGELNSKEIINCEKEIIKLKKNDFIELSFEKTEINNQFIFRDMYLGRTSFLHSNISCTNFFKCSWYNDGKRLSFDDKFILKGMSNVEKIVNKTDYEAMQKVYCQFKNIFENMKDWQIAGDFFIGEMEMRTQALKEELKNYPKDKINKIWNIYFYLEIWSKYLELRFLRFYKALSYYGERFQYTSRWIIIFLWVSSYWIFQLKNSSQKNPQNYLDALFLSIRSMTFQKDTLFSEYSIWVQRMITIQFIVGAILLWILLLAIKRKFRR